MKTLIIHITIAISLIAASMADAQGTQHIYSFKEWKSEKVQEALGKVVKLKTLLEVKKRRAQEAVAAMVFGEVLGQDSVQTSGQIKLASEEAHPTRSPSIEEKAGLEEMPLESLEIELSQAQFNLEVVKDLSVKDYFILYLSKQENRQEAYRIAATKLEPSELAELMSAYEQSMLRGSDGAATKVALASDEKSNFIK